MDPELWPRLRRLPEQQRDLISTRRNDGLLTGRRCGTLSLGKPLKTSTSRNDGLLTGRRCGTLSSGKTVKTSTINTDVLLNGRRCGTQSTGKTLKITLTNTTLRNWSVNMFSSINRC